MAARLLGLDVGTSVIKAVVFDLDGVEVAVAAVAVDVRSPRPGWAEQDMEAVWFAAARSISSVLAEIDDPGEIAAVGVAGQGDGAWMIDADGKPVAPAPLWSDGRATHAIERWLDAGTLSRLFERGDSIGAAV